MKKLLLILVIPLLMGAGCVVDNEERCQCFYETENPEYYVCYTPSGKLDTEGECVDRPPNN
jgi:hypothetical protein